MMVLFQDGTPEFMPRPKWSNGIDMRLRFTNPFYEDMDHKMY